MRDPRIIVQSSDPRFAQQNTRMVRIRTLRITYIYIHVYCISQFLLCLFYFREFYEQLNNTKILAHKLVTSYLVIHCR